MNHVIRRRSQRARDILHRRRLVVESLEDRRLLASDFGDAPDGPLAGLLSNWDGDATAGTTMLDVVGGNDGTLIGATIVPGLSGQAFSFDGVNDYAEVADSSSLDQPGVSDQVTLSAWVNWSGGAGFQPVVRKILEPLAAPWDAYGIEVYDDGRFFFRLSDGVNGAFLSSDADTRLEVGRWHHLAGTYDGAVQRLYLDGVEVSQQAVVVDVAVTSGPLRMGSEAPGGSNFFHGLIDEIAVYDRALTAFEVRYVAGGAPTYDTLQSNQGPSHEIDTRLLLGYILDADDGTLQNVSASADDDDGIVVDEDGLLDPQTDLSLREGDQPTVGVRVTNTTGIAATLYGWIDYNRDGVFDNATERASTVVPDNKSAQNVELSFPVVPSGSQGDTYARFRLSTDAAAANPTGAASDGEVEDHRVSIAASQYVVTTTADSGVGSLRQAIIDANTATQPVVIQFRIPPSMLTDGVAVIQPTSALDALNNPSHPIIIDGRTQTAFGGDTNPLGPEIVLDGTLAGENVDGIASLGNGNQILGLNIRQFSQDGIDIRGGSQAIIQGNYIGTDATGQIDRGNAAVGVRTAASDVLIGGESVADRNVVSGNDSFGVQVVTAAAVNNVIVGNFIGTNATGTADLGNSDDGVRIVFGPTGARVGGTLPARRNVISANNGLGVHVIGAITTGNVIQGNYIGTDVTGMVTLGNTVNGISIANGSSDNLIGGVETEAGNVISGNGGLGVHINNGSTNNTLLGNFIGVGADGVTGMGNSVGVRIDDSSNNMIGGVDPGERNVIGFSAGSGVLVIGGTGNTVRGNVILDNGLLSIDLGDDGVTLSDPLDADDGPNRLQNFGTIEVVGATVAGGSTTRVMGSFAGAPDAALTIDFYAATTPDPSGYGEGERYLDSINITTDAAGNADFDADLNAVTSSGEVVSMTVTASDAGTSEFSRSVVADRQFFVVSNIDDQGPGSLRQALIDANQSTATAIIDFQVPSNLFTDGVAVIQPRTELPELYNVDHPIILDGRTQTIFGGDANPLGPEVVLDGILVGAGIDGIASRGHRNQIIGLNIQRFTSDGIDIRAGDDVVVQGNYLGIDATGSEDRGNAEFGLKIWGFHAMIGGVTEESRNVISGNNAGIHVAGSGSVRAPTIHGNYIGTDATGSFAIGNDLYGINVSNGPGTVIGGLGPGEGNLVSGNGYDGILFQGGTAAGGGAVLGNLIGTDATGTHAIGNGRSGILFSHTFGHTVAGNLISGNDRGVTISQGGNHVVRDNRIGTDISGTLALPNRDGIQISGGALPSLIGGISPEDGNVISHNTRSGVVVIGDTTSGASIRGNTIADNGGLGIDLGGDGVTSDDLLDSDVGPNNLQNFGRLAGVGATESGATTTRVIGDFEGEANVTVSIDFFANSAADPSGHGEGGRYLDSISITTDASGNASFDVAINAVTASGDLITMTVTGPDGSTSEFAAAVAAVDGPAADSIRQTLNGGIGAVALALPDWGELLNVTGFDLPVIQENLATLLGLGGSGGLFDQIAATSLVAFDSTVASLSELRDNVNAAPGFSVDCIEGDAGCGADDLFVSRFSHSVNDLWSAADFHDTTNSNLQQLAAAADLNGLLDYAASLTFDLVLGVDTTGFFVRGDSSVTLAVFAVGEIEANYDLSASLRVDVGGASLATADLNVAISGSDSGQRIRIADLATPETVLAVTADGDAVVTLDQTLQPLDLDWSGTWSMTVADGMTATTADVAFPNQNQFIDALLPVFTTQLENALDTQLTQLFSQFDMPLIDEANSFVPGGLAVTSDEANQLFESLAIDAMIDSIISRLRSDAGLDESGEVFLPGTGLAYTQGDGILKADLLRTADIGLSGKGVKIGVISDGVYGLKQVSGLLNPALTSPEISPTHTDGLIHGTVTVHPDFPGGPIGRDKPGAGAEGTAMIEIIHDIAPQAEILFTGVGDIWTRINGRPVRQSVDGKTAFLEGLRWFLENDVDIIVDDIGFASEPFFSVGGFGKSGVDFDGNIAWEVRQIIESAAHDVLFVSAAGNDNGDHYQQTFDPGEVLLGELGPGSYHKFRPLEENSGSSLSTTDAQHRLSLVVAPGSTLSVHLQWSDDYANPEHDFWIGLYDANGVPLAEDADASANGDPHTASRYVGYRNDGRRTRRCTRSCASLKPRPLHRFWNCWSAKI